MGNGMTVGGLRAALALIGPEHDGAEVILRVSINEGEDTFLAGLQTAEIEAGCTETDALMLDGYDDADGVRACCAEYETGSGEHDSVCAGEQIRDAFAARGDGTTAER